MDGFQLCFVFKDTQPGSQWIFAPFLFLCFYPFLLETQTALLTNTPVPHVSPWRAFSSRCTSLRVLMGMSSRYMSLSTPLRPPTQLVRGGCLVGVTAKLWVGGGCCMWGLQCIPLKCAGRRGLRRDLTTLEQEDWGEAREKCLISAGRNRERGEDPLSGLSTASFWNADIISWPGLLKHPESTVDVCWRI